MPRPRDNDPDDSALDPEAPTDVDAPNSYIAATAPRGHLTAAESDPSTGLVRRNRRDSFRELPPGSIVDGTYEVDAKLGAGAMGEVYAARHVKLGKRVAIKVIGRRLSEDTAAMERFAMEARTLAQIQHPAIVAVDHVGELADGRAYFSMEFLRGETLFDRFSRGRLPLAEALHVLDQIARGLDAAHGSGVTHRDLKPENVFLVHLPGEPPIIKLLDFGLAKLRRADVDYRTERTQSGVAIGTPMYMSPEQARGPDVDYRTDIYALGCVAYELLLGVSPFSYAKTAPELYAAHLHAAPPLPRSIWPEIPPQLDLALFAMLAKDPSHRPTLEQVRAVIANIRTSTPSQHTATEFVGSRAMTGRLRATTIAMIVLAALIGGITIGTALTRSVPPTTQLSVTPIVTPIVTTPDAAPTTTPPVTPVHETAATPQIERPLPPLASRPRSTGNTGSETKTLATTSVDAGVDTSPIDASDIAIEDPPPPPPPPLVPEREKVPPKPRLHTTTIDRNQTMNPFAHKHDKASP